MVHISPVFAARGSLQVHNTTTTEEGHHIVSFDTQDKDEPKVVLCLV